MNERSMGRKERNDRQKGRKRKEEIKKVTIYTHLKERMKEVSRLENEGRRETKIM